MDETLKQDINFLEFPLWTTDEHATSKNNRLIIEREGGIYCITSPEGMPNHLDKILLHILLFELLRDANNTDCIIKTTRHELAKKLFPNNRSLGSKEYERVMSSLLRWKAIYIKFEGMFYANDEYTTRVFSIIDKFTLYRKTKLLEIKFSEDFIKQQRESSYFKYINITTFSSLKRPLSARLYEILAKTFVNNSSWSISLDKFAAKLTISKRKNATTYYSSDVLPRLIKSIAEYNEQAEHMVDFSYDKASNVCSFRRVKKEKKTITGKQKTESFKPARKSVELDENKSDTAIPLDKQKAAFMNEFRALSPDKQDIIKNAIKQEKFLNRILDEEMRIFTYMISRK